MKHDHHDSLILMRGRTLTKQAGPASSGRGKLRSKWEGHRWLRPEGVSVSISIRLESPLLAPPTDPEQGTAKPLTSDYRDTLTFNHIL